MGRSTWAHLAEILYKLGSAWMVWGKYNEEDIHSLMIYQLLILYQPGSTWMVWGKHNEEDMHSLMRSVSEWVVQLGHISLRFYINLDLHEFCKKKITKTCTHYWVIS